ncbi:hypothetical protein ACHAWF_017342 [Thalassiosira exigua]
MSSAAPASQPSRQPRVQAPSNDDGRPVGAAPGSNGGDPKLVLSLMDSRYRRIMWRQFNLLGTAMDAAREEKAAVELHARLKEEGTTFVRVGKGGRSLASEEQALEKITRDIRNRTASTHKWLESAANKETNAPEAQSVTNNSESSGEKNMADNDARLEDDSFARREMHPTTVDVECVDLDGEDSMPTKGKLESQDVGETSVHVAHFPPLTSSTGGGSREPNENDIILSFLDRRYKAVMLKCFGELGEIDCSSKRDVCARIVNKLKRQGGRFFKMGRGGHGCVETDEAGAIQRVERDFKRRRYLIQKYHQNVTSREEQDDKVLQQSEALEVPDITPQLSTIKRTARSICQDPPDPNRVQLEASSKSQATSPCRTDMGQSSQDADAATDRKVATGVARFCEEATATAQAVAPRERGTLSAPVMALDRAESQECQRESRPDEKKQDDHDAETSGAKIPPGGRESSALDVHDLGSSDHFPSNEARPERDQRETSGEEGNCEGRSPFHVILSLTDDRYKDIMWKHYRMLGKSKDSDRETEIGNEIFCSFKRQMGSNSKFFKRAHDQDIEVDDVMALAKIRGDIGRRMRNYHKWSNSRKKQASDPKSGVATRLRDRTSPGSPNGGATFNPNPIITEDHAWRDQLVPSPIDAMRDDYHGHDLSKPRHPPSVDQVVDSQAGSKSTTLPCRTKNRAKSKMELLMSSHLGQRLPPLDTIPIVKAVHTPNQLVHVLQFATHHLNQLYQTNRRTGQSLRLYHIPELNYHLGVTSKGAPTTKLSLSKLAKFMKTSTNLLEKYYIMYAHAFTSGFDFDKLGNAKIRDHQKAFFPVVERYKLSECGESAIREFFKAVGKKVVEDAQNIFAEVPGSDLVPDSDAKEVTSASPANPIDGVDEGIISPKSPFPRQFQRNRARLLQFISTKAYKGDYSEQLKSMKLCSIPKRIKKGEKDRMLCMVDDCEKYCQTQCDGCCQVHFRILSSITLQDHSVSFVSISLNTTCHRILNRCLRSRTYLVDYEECVFDVKEQIGFSELQEHHNQCPQRPKRYTD